MKLIIDSYAWVEFLLAGPSGPKVKRHLEGPNELLTPDVVLAEVARRLARDETNSGLISGHLHSMTALSTILSIDPAVAMETIGANLTLRAHSQRKNLGHPSFADAIILAFARQLRARVLTGDRHFEGLPETEWIGN